MTPAQKIQFIKELIHERVQLSPLGSIEIRLKDIPTFSLDDQMLVLKRLQQESFVFDVKFLKKSVGAAVTMSVLSTYESEMDKSPESTQPIRDSFLMTKDIKPDLEAGDLASYSDGTIRYKDTILKLRNQLKDLCRLFMRNPKRLLTPEDIKDNIIAADKRKITSNSTISKYVSELRNSLKVHFKKDVIFSQKEEGWHFDVTKT